jgi:biopolymer transport protein TolR
MARRPRRSMNQINVVPYIDVMLVLLVIFMVTTPMMQQGVVNLPTVGKADREVKADPLRVQIDKDGVLKLVDKSSEQALANPKALVAAVQEKLLTDPERPVVIGADKTVRYEVVMDAMSALKEANVARVGLQVESK